MSGFMLSMYRNSRERAELDDVRVCWLAVRVIEAQRSGIDEIDWLIAVRTCAGQVALVMVSAMAMLLGASSMSESSGYAVFENV